MIPALKRFKVTQPRLIAAFFALLFGTASIWVMRTFLIRSHYGHIDPLATITLMAEGKAIRPEVDHALLPAIANLLRLLMPESLLDAINGWVHAMQILPGFAQPYYLNLTVLFFAYVSLVTYLVLMYLLGRWFFPGNLAARYIAPALALFVIPTHFEPAPRIYDFTTLALSAACLYLLAKKEWGLYMVAFAAAVLNHQACLFFLAYFLIAAKDELPHRTLARLSLVQLIVVSAIMLMLWLMFGDNPALARPFSFAQSSGDVLGGYSYERFLQAAVGLMLLGFQWATKPRLLKQGLIFLPMFVFIALGFGLTYEYRLYFPLHPILILLATHTIVRIGREENTSLRA